MSYVFKIAHNFFIINKVHDMIALQKKYEIDEECKNTCVSVCHFITSRFTLSYHILLVENTKILKSQISFHVFCVFHVNIFEFELTCLLSSLELDQILFLIDFFIVIFNINNMKDQENTSSKQKIRIQKQIQQYNYSFFPSLSSPNNPGGIDTRVSHVICKEGYLI